MTFLPHHIAIGHGAPVLVFAGFGCSNWMYRDQAKLQRDHGLFVLPDNRGMGASPPVYAPYPLTALAEDGLALMDHLGHRRFAVVGISMGGFLATWLALNHPDRVTALVLLCATAPGEGFKPPRPVSEDELRQAYQLPPHQLAKHSVDQTVHPTLAKREPQIYRRILAGRTEHIAPLGQLLYQYRAVKDFLEVPLPIERIACPTLVMAGENDRTVDPVNARLLAERIPDAKLVLFDQADHLFFLEKPGPVAEETAFFLESLP